MSFKLTNKPPTNNPPSAKDKIKFLKNNSKEEYNRINAGRNMAWQRITPVKFETLQDYYKARENRGEMIKRIDADFVKRLENYSRLLTRAKNRDANYFQTKFDKAKREFNFKQPRKNYDAGVKSAVENNYRNLIFPTGLKKTSTERKKHHQFLKQKLSELKSDFDDMAEKIYTDPKEALHDWKKLRFELSLQKNLLEDNAFTTATRENKLDAETDNLLAGASQSKKNAKKNLQRSIWGTTSMRLPKPVNKQVSIPQPTQTEIIQTPKPASIEPEIDTHLVDEFIPKEPETIPPTQ